MSWALGSIPRATKTSFRSRCSGVGLQLVCVKDAVLCIKYVWHTVMSYCTLVEQGAEIYHLEFLLYLSCSVVGKQYVQKLKTGLGTIAQQEALGGRDRRIRSSKPSLAT